MESTINLDQSDFKRLIDRSGSTSSPDAPNIIKNLMAQICVQLGGKFSFPGKVDDYVDQLLTRLSIVRLIDKFIHGLMEGDLSLASKKNAAKSVDFRNRGNREFECRNFTQSAYLYTMAIIYAPNVDEGDDDPKDNVPEELSLAFGNRSAVFYELALYGACLEDIEHALATGYPRSKLSKLLLRKIECLILMDRFGDAKKALENLIATIGNEPKDDERILKIRLQLMNIKTDDNDNQKQNNQISLPSTNSMIPVINYLNRTGRYKPSSVLAPLSAKLEPRYSEDKGRHLVAKVDIEPGDILMLESPYMSALSMDCEFHFCHHCCRRLENDLVTKSGVQGQLCINGALVPCTTCTHVLYCSTVCRTESWRLYHQFECALQPVLYQLDKNCNRSVLALRMLLSTGLDIVQQVATRNKKEESKLPVLGNDPDVASQYEHVYRLVHHRDKAFLSTEFEYGLVNHCAILVQLTKKCGFVRTDKQAKLAGTILLRHLHQLRINTHSISSCKRTEKCFYLPFDMATGIFPYTSSLLNHSCDPNAYHDFHHGTLMIQRASRRIVAGTDVTTSYGPLFTEMDRAERQKTTLDPYRFVCDCSRCELEERDGLEGKYYPIGCQKCGCPLTRTSSTCSTFHCSSSSCASKGAKMSLSDAKRVYTRIESQLATVRQLVETYEQQFGAGQFCTENQLAQWERQLTELSSLKGMRNCWSLALFYNKLATFYDEHSRYPGTARKARQCYERFCEIMEEHRITPALFLFTARLANLYSKERDSSRGHKILHQRVVKRAIELLRLFSQANLQQNNGPDLMVDDATFLWEKHGQLVETLNGLK